MLALIDAALDVINAVAEPKANAKRLLEAKKKYGDDELIVVTLGAQTLLISEPLMDKLIESGLWGLLEQAAERGTGLNTITQQKKN